MVNQFIKYSGLANRIHKNLGDKEWAKKVYKKAEGKAEDYSDYSDLAESIIEDIPEDKYSLYVLIQSLQRL